MKNGVKKVKKLDFGLKNLVIKKIPRRLLFIVGYCSSARTGLGHGSRSLVAGRDLAEHRRESWSLPGTVHRLGIGSGTRLGHGSHTGWTRGTENSGRCRVVFGQMWSRPSGVRGMPMVSGSQPSGARAKLVATWFARAKWIGGREVWSLPRSTRVMLGCCRGCPASDRGVLMVSG